MSHHESTRHRLPKIEQYTDVFSAPREKREEVTKLLNVLTDYEIVSVPMPLESKTHNFVEYNLQMRNMMDLNMRIHGTPLRQYDYVNSNLRNMQQIESHLAFSQMLKIPAKKDSNVWNHTQSVYALAANVEIVDEILTNAKRGSAPRRPAFYIENDVPHPNDNKMIRTDLIIAGSDNRFRLFEHGNSTDKISRIRNQAAGLELLYREKTSDTLPTDRLLRHIVQYSVQDSSIDLDIYHIEGNSNPLPRRKKPEPVEVEVFFAAD